MTKALYKFYFRSIKHQLIIGIALVHALLMTIFVIDLVNKQQTFLIKQHNEKAISLSKTLASSATSWVLSNDYVGLSEVVTSMKQYPGIKYILITNLQGHILAHSNPQNVGKYTTDTKSMQLLNSKPISNKIFENKDFVDVASPILRDFQHIGWARIAISKNDVNEGVYTVYSNGFFYIILAIFIGIIFAWFMAKGITSGLYTILNTIKNIKLGDNGSRSNSTRKDELGDLSNEFDHLLDVIQTSNDEIKKSRLLLKNIIDTAPVRIFWKDINGVYLGANQLFLKDAGIESEDNIIGKTDWDMNWKSVAHLYLEDDKKIMDSKKSKLRYEEPQTYENGTTIILLTSKVPLMDENKNVYGILGVYDDITQQKSKDLLLLEQSKLAALGDMIGNIAHQWRQPLSLISVSAGSLALKHEAGTLSDKDIQEFESSILKNTQYLSDTIDTFRDFIKGGNKKENVKLCEVINEGVNIVKDSLSNNHILLDDSVACKENNNIEVYISRHEFAQVIINIVNNAKDVLLEREIENPWIKIGHIIEKNNIIITIEDNGGGIPDDIISKIFEPYFTTKHQSQGTGLGLHIAYKIITESIGGKIYVANTHSGAKFFLELPFIK